MTSDFYNSDSHPDWPNNFEAHVDISDFEPNTFIARVYWIDNNNDLCLHDELLFNHHPTAQDILEHNFSQ
jgi:hypothetical protein